MTLITNIIKDLFQNNRKDFRFIPFGFVLIYFLILLFSEFYFGSYAVIGKFFGMQPMPYFADLKMLLYGIGAFKDGVDPYNKIFFDGAPYFNYPYVWSFFSFIPFFTISNLMYIGFGLAITLFSILYFYIQKINFFGAIIYSMLLVSPAITLCVERGNCDLIIFLILLIPLFYKKNHGLMAIAILLTSFLKLFPIGAITCVINNVNTKTRKIFWLFLSVIIIFFMYLILFRQNIIIVSQKTPRPFGSSNVSYGLGEFPSIFMNYIKKIPSVSIAIKNFQSLQFFIYTVFIVLLVLAFIAFYLNMKKKSKIPLVNSDNKGISYLIGSGIFITTCLIGYNWDYRLIFLLFTIPQILIWISEKKIIARYLLFFSILIVWQSFLSGLFSVIGIPHYHFISQLLVIFLFYGHLSILLNFIVMRYRFLIKSMNNFIISNNYYS